MKTKLIIVLCLLSGTIIAENMHNGHEYVDLGLPSGTLWATCNVGTNYPEFTGSYFAWGEVYAKSYFVTKGYKTKAQYNKSIIPLHSSNDAANFHWGGKWHIPSREQFQELIHHCSWSYIVYRGNNCIRFVGPNNNFIILCSAGYYSEKGLHNFATSATYWTSSYPTYSPLSCCFIVDEVGCRIEHLESYQGLSIRPVCDKTVKETPKPKKNHNSTSTKVQAQQSQPKKPTLTKD